ncbi:FMN-dependent NADH-azoreductase [Streptomyces litchfieldiae]|uniref:FMN dependent NADH:quinone oxidoreductase n=1 Tax=Streptomyces litchfieldiae TaxID=3075543 RepID=A0ABU2MKT4_9ACTN|nr:NAD(P)H-dependent oxidoreductase [Streptomyces sp. DSM 44938]MDT0342212.1 NAD(P)H-dependent oxidoreductase [Streptomyces sp. DSM 44938]
MATLLHIDSSLNGEQSVSRAVTASFRKTWEEQHPEGTVIYRDLSAAPLPHLTAEAHTAGFVAPEDRTPEQRAAFAIREELLGELESVDAVLIGAPMYNWSIPSTLKTWLDNIVLVGRTAGGAESVAGKPITVVTSRGGSYAPGTPNEGRDYIEPYLQFVLGEQLKADVHFIVPELTLAPVTPSMAALVDKAHASRAQAHEDAEARAKALVTQLAA